MTVKLLSIALVNTASVLKASTALFICLDRWYNQGVGACKNSLQEYCRNVFLCFLYVTEVVSLGSCEAVKAWALRFYCVTGPPPWHLSPPCSSPAGISTKAHTDPHVHCQHSAEQANHSWHFWGKENTSGGRRSSKAIYCSTSTSICSSSDWIIIYRVIRCLA